MSDTMPARSVLAAPAELLDSTATAFSARVREALAGEPRHLVVDLSATACMDSSGLAALIRALREAREFGGTATLRRPQPRVRNVLWITGTSRLFDVEDENGS